MRTLIFLLLVISITASGQSREETLIIDEGKKLYKSEMASWYGSDIFSQKFSDKREDAGGYLSYSSNDRSVCVFFSRDSDPKIIASFTFDSTYNINTSIVDGQRRDPTGNERELIKIRQIALTELKTDTLFKFYKDMSANIIPLNDAEGKRVYILTGPKKQGVVVFGNDYLLTFNSDNILREKKRLHKNILTIDYKKPNEANVIATMHTHLPDTGDLITATDICTLMLYEKYAGWGQHYVMSVQNVSIWNCRSNELTVMTKTAWDKINEDQKKRK